MNTKTEESCDAVAGQVEPPRVEPLVSRFLFTHDTCPKDDGWFVSGGRCGWAYACDDCRDNQDRRSRG